MPLVSISEAARLAGKERSHFHKTYIRTGKITVHRKEKNRPQIDISDLLRVFGELKSTHTEETQEHTQPQSNDTALEIERLKEKIEGLEALADERKERIAEKDTLLAEKSKEIDYQRERIHGLEARYDKLLEDKREKDGLAHQLAAKLDEMEENRKGFWSNVIALFTK